MTSTITTLRQQVVNRLNSGTTAQEPTSDMIEADLRSAFKQLMGDLHPVTITTGMVGTDYTAPLGDVAQVFHVANGPLLLFPSQEWGEAPGGIVLTPACCVPGDEVICHVYAPPDVTATTVDTSCIFGNDWLEELAVVHAAMQACSRLFNIAASADNAGPGSFYRVLQEEREMLEKSHRMAYTDWQQRMASRLQSRGAMGNTPFVPHAYAGFENASVKINLLTGARSS